jgi:hypothetical protein
LARLGEGGKHDAMPCHYNQVHLVIYPNGAGLRDKS